MNPRRWRVARHEAGHMLAILALHGELLDVDFSDGDDPGGYVDGWMPGGHYDALTVVLAGPFTSGGLIDGSDIWTATKLLFRVRGGPLALPGALARAWWLCRRDAAMVDPLARMIVHGGQWLPADTDRAVEMYGHHLRGHLDRFLRRTEGTRR